MKNRKYSLEAFQNYMEEYRSKTGFYPSNKKLQEHFHVSAMTVWNYWNRLRDEAGLDLAAMKEHMEKNISPTHKLVDHSNKILAFIVKYNNDNGFAPSAQEISDEIGVSTAIVYKNLNRMEQKGMISRRENTPRSIVVL